MAKFDKIAVMQKIGAAPMVPVFYNKDLEIQITIIVALLFVVDGGIGHAHLFTDTCHKVGSLIDG